MKTALMLLAAAIPVFAQQTFDFKSLDKLGANAKQSTNITLEGDTLKLATSLLEGDRHALKSLTGVYVRSFEFSQAGQYDPADLGPFRAYVKTLNWSKIVDVKDANETKEIYIQAQPNSQLGGLAIISAEPKEVKVVFISGVLNLRDAAMLGGNLGIPSMILNYNGTKSDNPKKE